MKKTLLLLLIFGVLSQAVLAQIIPIDTFNTRQNALGNVRVALPEPSRALFTNPAGLSVFIGENPLQKDKQQRPSTKRNYFSILKFTGSFQDSAFDTLDTLQSLSDTTSTTEKIDVIRDLIPQTNEFKSNLDILFWTRKNFGIGIYTNNLISFNARRKSNPELVLNFNQDIVLGVGYSKVFKDTAIGITPKLVNRINLYDQNNLSNPRSFELSQDDLIDISNDDNADRLDDFKALHSKGFLLDIGFLRTLDTPYGNGHWGATITNIGPELSGKPSGSDQTVKTKVPSTGTIGASIASNSTNFLLKDTIILADFDVLTEAKDFKKRIHMGIERELFREYNNFLAKSLFVRAGINQGFIVGGFGIKLFNFRSLSLLNLDYSYFTEELGEKIGMNTAKFHTIQLSFIF